MTTLETIRGVWKPVAYEQDGVAWTGDQLLRRAHLILIADGATSTTRGVWGEVKYHGEPTASAVARSIESLRHLVGGLPYGRSDDYYLYSGGVIALGETAEGGTIDLVVHHGAHTPPPDRPSVTRGLFRYDGTKLALCLVDADVKERPVTFGSTGTRYQSLSTYVRETTG
ncbi:MAG: hypothetical protein ACRC33_10065 [Gemmataceae bacterium]